MGTLKREYLKFLRTVTLGKNGQVKYVPLLCCGNTVAEPSLQQKLPHGDVFMKRANVVRHKFQYLMFLVYDLSVYCVAKAIWLHCTHNTL